MKIRYHISGTEKVYTLKEEINNKPTKEAHYKFIRLRDAPKSLGED